MPLPASCFEVKMIKEDEGITILDERIVAFDCDDTLVMWDSDFTKPGPGKIEIVDPYDNAVMYLTPHKKHIQKMRGYSNSGWFVIIWSAGGGPWAKAVRDTLGLKKYANLTMGKPEICYDDMPVGEGIGRRVWMHPKKVKNGEE